MLRENGSYKQTKLSDNIALVFSCDFGVGIETAVIDSLLLQIIYPHKKPVPIRDHVPKMRTGIDFFNKSRILTLVIAINIFFSTLSSGMRCFSLMYSRV